MLHYYFTDSDLTAGGCSEVVDLLYSHLLPVTTPGDYARCVNGIIAAV